MTPEQKHQLYGGEVSDYMSQVFLQRKYEDPQHTDSNIANIYDTQVKGKPSINTTGLISANFNIPRTRDPHFDALDIQLRDTLNTISKQIGLQGNDSVATVPDSISIKNQTQADIDAANSNVLNALKELQDLKAI